ncbi:MAG: CehA/McbA family metallohydrolase [Candidatus Sumerlaeia bacterium]|nr:CehA/McbA family metallohydrolase [Candidatus Sumerlaeia bacterium]
MRRSKPWNILAAFPSVGLAMMITPTILAADPMSEDEFRHYYRLFSDTAYIAPTSLQPDTLLAAEQIFEITDGWRPVTDEQREQTTRDTLAHYNALTERYPTYRVRILDGADPVIVRAVNDAPEVTPGLLRLFIVEVNNATGEPLHLTPVIEESIPYGRPSVMIYPGETLPTLVPIILPPGDREEVTLTFLPAGNNTEAPSTTLPISIKNAATINGTTINGATGDPYPSRVYAIGSDGIYRHAREFGTNRTLSEKPVVFRPAMMKVPFFYTDGTFTVDMPAGETTLILERGYETPLKSSRIQLDPGENREISIESQRHHDMMERGWISGDTHIHWAINEWNENEDIDLLAMVQRAEDLRIANNLTLYQWQPDGGTFIKPDQYPMGPVERLSNGEYHIQMAEEFRNDNHYGHINLLNIKELIEPISTGPGSGGPPDAIDYPINAEIIRQAHAQGGISIEAHNLGPFFASGVPANIIHGLSDSLDQLEPANYYNFLNAGFRIGLSNGSDHPARLVGICRVYVHAPGPLDYGEWCRRLAEGRTFTTSGPLLTLTVNGHPIGDVIEASHGEELKVEAEVWSRHPIGKLQIVSNGEILGTLETEETVATLSLTVPANEPRWFTARTSKTESFDALSGPDIAHTSGIYVEVDGEAVFFPEAAEGWIENLGIHRQRLVQSGNFDNDEQRQEALDYIDEAIDLYRQRIEAHRGSGQ